MSTVSTLAFAAGTWGVLMSLAPLLQIRAMVRAGTSDGVSLGYLRVLLVGFVLWLAYGLARGDLPLIVCNALAAVVGAVSLAVASRYRSDRRISPRGPALADHDAIQGTIPGGCDRKTARPRRAPAAAPGGE